MTLNEALTIGIASLSLVVSSITAWLTLVRSGRVKMTRPAIVGFAFDGASPEVFLRFLLYNTAQRGNVVDGMYVIIIQGEKRYVCTAWIYEETPKVYVRGSGLFVTRGVSLSIITLSSLKANWYCC